MDVRGVSTQSACKQPSTASAADDDDDGEREKERDGLLRETADHQA